MSDNPLKAESGSVLAKYIIIGLTRVLGIAIMAVGFAVLLNNLGGLPDFVGYIFIALGFFQAIGMPFILGRLWKSQDKKNAGISDGSGARKE